MDDLFALQHQADAPSEAIRAAARRIAQRIRSDMKKVTPGAKNALTQKQG